MQPRADEEFGTLLGRCERQRLVGLLGAAVGAGAFPVTDAQHGQLEEVLQRWCAHALRAERMLLRAIDVLERTGIRSRVLEGVALAHTAYPEPEQRAVGDVALLVPSADLGRAAEALSTDFDARRAGPELRPGFDATFGTKVVLTGHAQLQLELHRVLVDGPLGLTIVLDDLFAPPYRFPLAGFELAALPMPQRLLHACDAATSGDHPLRLISRRDVAQLVLREKPNLVDVLLMARSWRCEAVVARAVSRAWEELGIEPRPPIVEWAERYEPTPRDLPRKR